ncbi:Poly polymerase central domain containing protein [Trichomonas vaginalis G3]|uniref:polynucleotide adenylyltransferase n=1 Tax=Trichomonas vaginalis (strain ATCC PRA-98 / G3) TaxID=412133 RepID=A2DFN8_TRIV3|nr:polynucleotide adenylyltransferase protein [Trichomonas vaginalis G3]EAY20741.1 Poly polymerase central domain containing protein [Trichomonas vaginalis G3]KAI5529484.1 polynucleotide adenylyltransferase protein [Trichomonas vaginalis G3]|eukprot:XP_001581727.1 Poly polymerase central domain containing protein [Trichomonas vaginalis G3]
MFGSSTQESSPNNNTDSNPDESIRHVIRSSKLMPTLEDYQSRKIVVYIIKNIAIKFAERKQRLSFSMNTDPKSPEIFIHENGSYLMDTWEPDSDVDVILIAPKYFTYKDFFEGFYEELIRHPSIKETIKVENAFVPIIKTVCNDISVDISFAPLNNQIKIKNLNNIKKEDMDKLEPKAQLSLNGYLNCLLIRDLMKNHPNFPYFTRFIRNWAQKREIFGNLYGYLKGINISMMCAIICNQHPNCSLSMLIFHFFEYFSSWDWDIQLNLDSNTPDFQLNDPMILMTQSYPQINSLRAVTTSSRKRIIKELQRALETTKKALISDLSWQELFKGGCFFADYRYFLCIDLIPTNSQIKDEIIGFLSSKLTRLVKILEEIPGICEANIWPSKISYGGKIIFYIGLNTKSGQSKTIDINHAKNNFISYISSSTLGKAMSINFKIIRKKELKQEPLQSEVIERSLQSKAKLSP